MFFIEPSVLVTEEKGSGFNQGFLKTRTKRFLLNKDWFCMTFVDSIFVFACGIAFSYNNEAVLIYEST